MVVVLFWGEARPASSVEWERATINLWNTATTRHSHLMGSKYFFKVLSQNQFPHHRRNNDLVRVSCFRILCSEHLIGLSMDVCLGFINLKFFLFSSFLKDLIYLF